MKTYKIWGLWPRILLKGIRMTWIYSNALQRDQRQRELEEEDWDGVRILRNGAPALTAAFFMSEAGD